MTSRRCIVCLPNGGQYPLRKVIERMRMTDGEDEWFVDYLECQHLAGVPDDDE